MYLVQTYFVWYGHFDVPKKTSWQDFFLWLSFFQELVWSQQCRPRLNKIVFRLDSSSSLMLVYNAIVNNPENHKKVATKHEHIAVLF